MAFDLLRHSNRRQEIRAIIQDISGKKFNLGPYRPPERQEKTIDPMEKFKSALADSGIAVEES